MTKNTENQDRENREFTEKFYDQCTLAVFEDMQRMIRKSRGEDIIKIRDAVIGSGAATVAEKFGDQVEQESQSSKEIIAKLSKDEGRVRGLEKQLEVLSKMAAGKPNIEAMMGKIRGSALQMKGQMVAQCKSAVETFDQKSDTLNCLYTLPHEAGADQNVQEVREGINEVVCQYSGPGYDLIARSSFIGFLDSLSENGEDLFKNLFPKDAKGDVQISTVASGVLGVNPEIKTYEGREYIALDSDFYNNSIFGRDEQSQKAFLQVVEFYNHNLIDKELTPEAGIFANVVLDEMKSDFRQNSLNPQYNFDREEFFSKCVTKTAQIVEKSYGASRSVPGTSPATPSVSPLALNRGAEVLSPA